MRRRLRCPGFVLGAALFLTFLVLPAYAAAGTATDVRDWAIVLREINQYIAEDEQDSDLTQGYLFLARQVRTRAQAAKSEAEEELRSTERLLAAIGPPPPQGAPPEKLAIAERRARYNSRIAALRTVVAQADLALLQAGEAEEALSRIRLELSLEGLSRRTPVPLSPAVIAKGAPAMVEELGRALRSALDWRRGLPPGESALLVLLPGVGAMVLGALLGWGIRRSVVEALGKDPAASAPSYARRLTGAMAEGLGNGALPVAALAGLYLWAVRLGGLPGEPFARTLASFAFYLSLFFLVAAFARAVLSPEQPNWRLTTQSSRSAQDAYRFVLALAAVFFLDLFLSGLRGEAGSAEAASLHAAAFGVLEGWLLVKLGRGKLWRSEETGEAPARVWRFARRAARGLAVVGVAAVLVGYGVFGQRLLANLVWTALVIAIIVLLRGLVREAASWSTRSGFVEERLRVSSRVVETLHAWERAFVDPLVFVLGFLVVAPVWGVPPDELLGWVGNVLSEFRLGSIRISVLDIFLAILVFFLSMAAVRFVQRQLSARLLERANLPEGVRHTLSAGVGYAGVIVAVLLSLSVTGISFTNLALVASALSLGVGFGLQNVVNNFVSGLILLVERPVKVGDWVRVGEHEGIVKRIQFRATELETWQRASVIIPNAEIVSSSVVNLTHRDQYGRVEVSVGVAYGSDVEKVRDILLGVARENERVSTFPAPHVVFRDFGASSLDFELRCFTPNVMSRLGVASELRFEIDRRFGEEGIEIPFPQRVVHLANPPENAPPKEG